MSYRVWLPVVVLAMVLTRTAAGGITTESLLNDMTDLQRLVSLPTPAYTTRQFSSYNRQSKTPDDAEGWFANRDRGQYLRDEKAGDRTEYVMMDADGRGAIVRIWSANPKARCESISTGRPSRYSPPRWPTCWRQGLPACPNDRRHCARGDGICTPHPLRPGTAR